MAEIIQPIAAPINTEVVTPTKTPMETVSNPTTKDSEANPEGLINVTTPEIPKSDIVAAQETNIKTTEANAANLQAEQDKRAAEDAAQLEKDKKAAEDYAKEQQAIINKGSEDVGNTQAEIDRLAQERKDRDSELIRQEQAVVQTRQDAEIEMLKQEKALQKQKDDNALLAAQQSIELEKQKAGWAFNKLGLGFSSGIILETQQIATNGANKLAELKIQASYNQAKIGVEIVKVMEEINKTQLGYTKEINATIDKYTDIQLTNKDNIAKRINDVNNNLLLSNKEKEDQINALSKEYLTGKRAAEDGLKTEQERLADKLVTQTRQLQNDIEAGYALGKTRINEVITSGSIFNMSSIQLKEMADKAGISVNELQTVKQNSLNSKIYTNIGTIMGEDFIPTEAQKLLIEKNTLSLIYSGKTIDDATFIATNNVMKTTPEYIANERIKKLTLDAKEKSFINNVISKSSTDTYKAKASDFDKIVSEDGTVKYVNKLTQDSFTAMEDGTVQVGSGEPTFLNPSGAIYGQGKVPIKANIKTNNVVDIKDLISTTLPDDTTPLPKGQ